MKRIHCDRCHRKGTLTSALRVTEDWKGRARGQEEPSTETAVEKQMLHEFGLWSFLEAEMVPGMFRIIRLFPFPLKKDIVDIESLH